MLRVAQWFGFSDADYNQDIESVVTYNLTSVCYDNDLDYQMTKPIIPYLQSILVNQNFIQDESMSDCLMGIESILIQGGSSGVKDFMSFDKIDSLIQKLVNFKSQNLHMLMNLSNSSSLEDHIH